MNMKIEDVFETVRDIIHESTGRSKDLITMDATLFSDLKIDII